MNRISILLVEDNEGDIYLTLEALKDAKITNEVNVVRDGIEALQYLEKSGNFANAEKPGLILLDINLPKMNGHEVLRRIKTNEDFKTIPVIILTTSSSEKDVIASYQQYANCFITKPVDVNNFYKVITTLENFWISIVTLPNNE